MKKRDSCFFNLVCHGFLGCLPIVRVVGQGDDEERTPEYQVGHRDHDEHFHLSVIKSKIKNQNCDHDEHVHLPVPVRIVMIVAMVSGMTFEDVIFKSNMISSHQLQDH